MRISIYELSIWLILWFSLSLFFGFYTGGHAGWIIPILGAFYGFVAGAIYSIESLLYRKKRGEVSFLLASIFGLLASASAVPIFVTLSMQLSAALFFAVYAGPITGVFVNFIVRRKCNNEANS